MTTTTPRAHFMIEELRSNPGMIDRFDSMGFVTDTHKAIALVGDACELFNKRSPELSDADKIAYLDFIIGVCVVSKGFALTKLQNNS